MTYFYVCLRNQQGYRQWHAGITDASTYKKRSSSYEDCIFWEDLGSRKNASRFEAITERMIESVFYEENLTSWINSDDEDISPEERQEWIDLRNEGAWWKTYTGGDTGIAADALDLATVYQKMLSLYEQDNLPYRASNWVVVKFQSELTAAEVEWRECVRGLQALKRQRIEMSEPSKNGMW